MNQELLNEYMKQLTSYDYWYNRFMHDYNNIPWALKELNNIDNMIERMKGDSNE